MKVSELIKSGEDICEKNSFYNSLKILLKYFFLSSQGDINLLDLVKNVSKSETEYKVFMVYKNYALDLYYTKVKHLLKGDQSFSCDDVTSIIIHFVKTLYDEDHKVISPYITGLDNEETIRNFNFIRSTYTIDKEQLKKVNDLQEAINLLEESKKLEKKARICRDKALSILYDVKNDYENLPKMIENTPKISKNLKFLL